MSMQRLPPPSAATWARSPHDSWRRSARTEQAASPPIQAAFSTDSACAQRKTRGLGKPEIARHRGAQGDPCRETHTIDDGETEPTRGHDVSVGREILEEGDLHAAHAGSRAIRGQGLAGGMRIAQAVRTKKHHAVAVATIEVGVLPHTVAVQAYNRLEPAGPVQIRPLVREAQMQLDDAPADRLDVDHAGVIAQMAANPLRAIALERRSGARLDDPVIEGGGFAGDASSVAAPHRFSLDDRPVGADVLAGEQRHPEILGAAPLAIILRVAQHAATRSHALEIDDGLAKNRIVWRRHLVGATLDALRARHSQLVIDEAVRRIEAPGIDVGGGNVNVRRALDMGEVLLAPRIAFVDRHKWSLVCPARGFREGQTGPRCRNRPTTGHSSHSIATCTGAFYSQGSH